MVQFECALEIEIKRSIHSYGFVGIIFKGIYHKTSYKFILRLTIFLKILMVFLHKQSLTHEQCGNSDYPCYTCRHGLTKGKKKHGFKYSSRLAQTHRH